MSEENNLIGVEAILANSLTSNSEKLLLLVRLHKEAKESLQDDEVLFASIMNAVEKLRIRISNINYILDGMNETVEKSDTMTKGQLTIRVRWMAKELQKATGIVR